MNKHCPQDGGFIGKSGCTHQNHQHSEFVKSLIASASSPHKITPADCDRALREGFYVNTASGARVGFGEHLSNHLGHHNAHDQVRRKMLLLYAVSAVKSGKKGRNPKGGANSFAYAKTFGDTQVLVLTDEKGQVEDVFSIIPKRGRK